MISFEEQKEATLNKVDKSFKGAVDERIKELCDTINATDSYFTTSSCSGRVSLLVVKGRQNKKESCWLVVTHDRADLDVFSEGLDTYKEDEKIYFKQESAILHVQARTLEDAEKLITLGKQSGFNRCGIITTKKRIIVELICSANIYTPVYDKEVLVDESYFTYLIQEANKKQDYSWECINKLNKAFL